MLQTLIGVWLSGASSLVTAAAECTATNTAFGVKVVQHFFGIARQGVFVLLSISNLGDLLELLVRG